MKKAGEGHGAGPPEPLRRDVPLAMTAQQFRELGHELVDTIATLLETLPRRPVVPSQTPAQVRSAIGAAAPLPGPGSDAGELLRSAATVLAEHSLFNGHPAFYGYITASPAPIGILAELLAAAINPNVGGWTLAPAATEIEAQTVRWIAELIGFPANGGGLLVSGGNMANFVCFLAARRQMASWDVRAGGLNAAGASRLRVYCSAETHTWVQKAADLFGLGTDAIRWITVDDEFRMDVSELRRVIAADRAAGHQPMIVIATAGSVSTGAIDPIGSIADLCEEQNVWLHVDGAYGALAACAPEAPPELQNLRRADSVAVDPHKWLYSPLEAGCALVRNAATLTDAFSYHPPYYHFAADTINYVDYGLQNSRGFRALKVWLALRHAGRDGYAKMIGDDIRLSRRLFRSLEQHAGFDAVTQALSIATFRYIPPDLRLRLAEGDIEEYVDTLNRELLDHLQKSGDVFVSNAVVRGRYLLRACIVNFNTTAADVDALPEMIAAHAAELDRRLRPAILKR
jgi:aromatic-L-amino-acid/L-tryptophan decarboxylase